jgi:hypothetical protein
MFDVHHALHTGLHEHHIPEKTFERLKSLSPRYSESEPTLLACSRDQGFTAVLVAVLDALMWFWHWTGRPPHGRVHVGWGCHIFGIHGQCAVGVRPRHILQRLGVLCGRTMRALCDSTG